VEPTDSN